LTDRAVLQRSYRKARDRSMALLLVGIVLLTPPVVGVSLIDGKIAGIPVPLFYIFIVWALLIAGTALLSRRLTNDEPLDESNEIDDT